MKYAYIVTRITRNNQDGITEIPNLGVHSNFIKAKRHFKSVYDSRTKEGDISVIGYDMGTMEYANPSLDKDERYVVIQSAITSKGEEIRLEKWRVK